MELKKITLNESKWKDVMLPFIIKVIVENKLKCKIKRYQDPKVQRYKPRCGYTKQNNVLYVLGSNLNIDTLHSFFFVDEKSRKRYELKKIPSENSEWIKLVIPPIDEVCSVKLGYCILIKEFTFDDYLYEIKSRDTTENKENLQIQVNDNFLSFRELSEENYKDNKNLKNLNRRDGIGCTLLFWVVYTEDIERVKYLLSIGAFPNISNYFGETPLHIAVMKNNKIIVNELLQYGAEINIENIYGETPRFYAYRNKNSDEIIKNIGEH